MDRAVVILELLEVQPVGVGFAAVELAAVDPAKLVASGLEQIGPENSSASVVDPRLADQPDGEILGRAEFELAAHREIVIAFEVVGPGGNVVDPVLAMLIQCRHPQIGLVADWRADRAFEIDAVVAAVADPGEVAAAGRADGVELDDAGRGIAPEQGTLRSPENLDPVDVEHREAFEDRAFQHHIIVQQADRLRGVQVEIGIAETANVEARKGPSERAFDVEARDSPGE